MRGRSGSDSQSLDQFLYPAEQGEDRHRQHDVDKDGHVAPVVYGLPDFGGLYQRTPWLTRTWRPLRILDGRRPVLDGFAAEALLLDGHLRGVGLFTNRDDAAADHQCHAEDDE